LTVSRAAHKNRRNINYPKKQKKTKKKKKVYHFLSVLKYESCMSKSFFFLVEIYLFIFFVQCHKFFFLEMYVRGKKCRSLGLQQQPLSISAFQTKNQKKMILFVSLDRRPSLCCLSKKSSNIRTDKFQFFLHFILWRLFFCCLKSVRLFTNQFLFQKFFFRGKDNQKNLTCSVSNSSNLTKFSKKKT